MAEPCCCTHKPGQLCDCNAPCCLAAYLAASMGRQHDFLAGARTSSGRRRRPRRRPAPSARASIGVAAAAAARVRAVCMAAATALRRPRRRRMWGQGCHGAVGGHGAAARPLARPLAAAEPTATRHPTGEQAAPGSLVHGALAGVALMRRGWIAAAQAGTAWMRPGSRARGRGQRECRRMQLTVRVQRPALVRTRAPRRRLLGRRTWRPGCTAMRWRCCAGTKRLPSRQPRRAARQPHCAAHRLSKAL